jgi:sphingomyelin phosphodiesterase
MTIGTRTSELFCLTIFGLCDWPAVADYTVSMSAKPSSTRPVVSGKTPIQVVHISDIHVDLSYEAGASYDCTKNICCRPYTSADAVGNNSYPAGEYVSTFICYVMLWLICIGRTHLRFSCDPRRESLRSYRVSRS